MLVRGELKRNNAGRCAAQTASARLVVRVLARAIKYILVWSLHV